jgi:hypothetical protein
VRLLRLLRLLQVLCLLFDGRVLLPELSIQIGTGEPAIGKSAVAGTSHCTREGRLASGFPRRTVPRNRATG